MMHTGCGEFEDLLAGYDVLEPDEQARVDAHVAQCPACEALAQALLEVGTALTAEYGEVCAPPALLDRVARQISVPKPSSVPAILDMVAWSAVACAGGMLAWFIAPPGFTFTAPMLYGTAGVLTLSGLAVTIWAFSENEN
jgi:anti-sigma factor RsiW